MIRKSPVLEALENESIEIFRETAAAFRKPVMLYCIGKGSSVLLHLARKAFAPGPIPFPLMHMEFLRQKAPSWIEGKRPTDPLFS